MPIDPDSKPFEHTLSQYQFLEPDKRYCQVIDYNLGHSQLLIRVTHAETHENLSLVFLDTLYFEGPLSWQGAAFQVASIEKCELLLRKILNKTSESTLQIMLEVQRLFMVEDLHSGIMIKIMAGVAFVTDRKVSEFIA